MSELLKKSEAKFEAEFKKSSKMNKQISYLTDLLLVSKNEEHLQVVQKPSDEKLKEQISYLTDLLAKSEAK